MFYKKLEEPMIRFVILASLLLSGCGSSDDSGTQNADESPKQNSRDKPYCTYSNCPGEPLVYPDNNACDNLYAGPCIEEWKTWNECVLSTEQCGDDGRVIPESVHPCDDVFATLNECLSKAAG